MATNSIQNINNWKLKTNSLFDLINYQPDIDKIYLYAKEPYEAKYQFLTNKRESTSLKILKLLLNTQITWTMFIKILKNIIQIRHVKY